METERYEALFKSSKNHKSPRYVVVHDHLNIFENILIYYKKQCFDGPSI